MVCVGYASDPVHKGGGGPTRARTGQREDYLGDNAGLLVRLLVLSNRRVQHGTNSFIKYVLETFLRQCRTLEIFDCTDILGHRDTLCVLDRSHASVP